jgi:uncharacterized membrane protein
MTLPLAFLIGLLSGLRSLTPIAVVSWAIRLGVLKLQGPLSWIGSTAAVAVFTALAIVELVTDKLPKTSSRTAPPGLIARIVLGALAGACVAMAGVVAYLVGAVLGVVGALVGAFGGYQARTRLVKALGSPDFVIALVEDLVTICGSIWVVTRFS